VPARTDELWTAFGGTLKRFIAKRVPDEHEAEDLLQEVLNPPLAQALYKTNKLVLMGNVAFDRRER
jgi:hypothetical protein